MYSNSSCISQSERRPMTEASVSAVQRVLDQLRTELVDRAYELESQRRMDAADVAIAAAARVDELSRAVGEPLELESRLRSS
jgi:hypothetical protein